MCMKAPHGLSLSLLLSGLLSLLMVSASADNASTGSNLVARGRYLIQVSGCNDCHTDAYLINNGNIPVDQWLRGSNFGWSGPWGTTYASNLRLFMQHMSEAEWINIAHSLSRRPPMPWFNLNKMHDDDLRAIYHFVRSLGDPGEPAPAYLPPGEEPNTPYASFPAPPSTN
jgi:mono/diheme cytochrome c family protein